MIYQGKAITVAMAESRVAEMIIDLKGDSVNKFNHVLVSELKEALDALYSAKGVDALIILSGKETFIAGADIAEFGPAFAGGADAIGKLLQASIDNFNRVEDLPFPVVAAVNGFALGGGLEFILACDYRVVSSDAKLGLPETQLGIIPGWGGTVRLPRVAGVDTAVEWIASGKHYRAPDALKAGVVDAVVDADQLRSAALHTALQCAAGKLNYQLRRQQKISAIPMNMTETMMAFETSKAFVASKAGRNYPAPVAAISTMQRASTLGRDGAQKAETETFVKMAQTQVARSLVGIFLNDQLLSKKAKVLAKQADKPIEQAAVLGAGIMGGGIAYQSALKGKLTLMKDVNQAGIDLGLNEANKLLSKRVERGRMSASELGEVLNRIDPTLTYGGFDQVQIVVEAVVENVKVKQSVLKEVEAQVAPDTVIASNTSTISIDTLAESLQRPENFCGMHFFNPVHAMPLVEVIRGSKTSDNAIARTVAYANDMGKKAVVVKDCPGFLVNRILFPYLAGFSMLVRDGVDFQHIDKVMEKWGWPMGPAYLLDVVGIDTGVHAGNIMAAAFPDRMSRDSFKDCVSVMFEAERLGQKNNKGFYNYEIDKKGKPKKVSTDESYELIKPHVQGKFELSDEDIVARMMVPMATELARCLEEAIVESPAEADMALVYGIGFPPFRGGLFSWLDSLGLTTFCQMADKHKGLGALYVPTEKMRSMASADGKYFDGFTG